MEGTYGLIIAIILYFPIAPLLGENPPDATSFSNGVIGLSVGWTLLVTVTGIFNIAATAVTSSMTRNVWKNLRTLLVWIIGLIIFYGSISTELGEAWYTPESFYILLGFCVMCFGIFIYYGKGSQYGQPKNLSQLKKKEEAVKETVKETVMETVKEAEEQISN